jgi:hypothetical protein
VDAQNFDSQIRDLAPEDLAQYSGKSGELQIRSLLADLDNTGDYGYLVVAYAAPLVGGDLVVLRNQNGRLQVAGRVKEGEDAGLDTNSRIQLVYVDNSGVPAIEIDTTSADGRNIAVHILRWTGKELESMLPPDTTLANSYFVDPDGTGVLKIVNPQQCLPSGQCNGQWQVFELKASNYVLATTSTEDPGGLTAAAGEALFLPGAVEVTPNEFSVNDILGRSLRNKAGGDIVVRLGNFFSSRRISPIMDISEIDLESMFFGRNIKPKEIRIIAPKEGVEEGFGGRYLEIILPRLEVFRFLAKAQLSKPPADGDAIELPIHGRLRSGVSFYGSATIKIVDGTLK